MSGFFIGRHVIPTYKPVCDWCGEKDCPGSDSLQCQRIQMTVQQAEVMRSLAEQGIRLIPKKGS